MFKLRQLLELRHINMIALGGSVGTGIFLTSGYSIFVGGPGGALFAYLVMALIVYFIMTSLGELSAYRPSSGSFCDYSNIYVNPSFGFAMGYNYWFGWAVTIATEISASVIVVSYWFPNINVIVTSFIIFLLIFITNFVSVRIYGEIEYWLSFLKITVIIIFIILGLYTYSTHVGANSIHNVTPFKYIHPSNNWTLFHNDKLFHQGWLGILSVFLFAGFSFQGIELVGIASGEAKHPEKSIPKAINIVFRRLATFYILSILVIALLITYNDPQLASQNNVNISPYTLIFSNYIGKYAADFINLIIFIALISTANASTYTATRVLWYMGKVNHSHQLMTKLNKHHIPVTALIFTLIVSIIFYIFSLASNGEVLTYLVQISSLSGFIAWFGIAYSHYRFRYKYLPNVGGETSLKYSAKFFPFAPIISMIVILFIMFSQFIVLRNDYTIVDFIMLYSSVLLFILLYCGHKFYLKHKLI